MARSIVLSTALLAAAGCSNGGNFDKPSDDDSKVVVNLADGQTTRAMAFITPGGQWSLSDADDQIDEATAYASFMNAATQTLDESLTATQPTDPSKVSTSLKGSIVVSTETKILGQENAVQKRGIVFDNIRYKDNGSIRTIGEGATDVFSPQYDGSDLRLYEAYVELSSRTSSYVPGGWTGNSNDLLNDEYNVKASVVKIMETDGTYRSVNMRESNLGANLGVLIDQANENDYYGLYGRATERTADIEYAEGQTTYNARLNYVEADGRVVGSVDFTPDDDSDQPQVVFDLDIK